MAHLKTTVLILITFLVNSVNVAGDQTYTVRTYGDPIIQNLDKIQYSFEGRGEFVYLKTENVTVQIRTEYITPDNHAATYITALAIKENDVTVEIYENKTVGLLTAFSNSEHLCNSDLKRPYRVMPFTILPIRGQPGFMIHSKGLSELVKQMLVQDGGNGLSITLTVNTLTDHSTVRGLAGRLVMRDETVSNATTNKQFYDFGDTWRIRDPNESISHYAITGGNYSFYNIPIEAPVFLENLLNDTQKLFNQGNRTHTKEEISNFTSTCKANTDCLLAIARTGDVKAGQAIMKDIADKEFALHYKANVPPEFLPNMATEVSLDLRNRSYVLDLKKYTRDNNTNDTLTFGVETTQYNDSYSFDHGVFTLNVTEELRRLAVKKFTLNFYVKDTYNRSAVSTLNIIFCGCEQAIQCAYNLSIGDNSKPIPCNCGLKFNGLYCETEIPICNVTTCFEQDKCNNSAHGENPCAPCPSGYSGDGINCGDIDECFTGDSDCSQDCHNEVGSYKCSCETGFTLGTDQHTCEDNDECALAADKCVDKANTKCHNTDGSFICMCVEGFYKNKEDACESEASVGRYVYYSELSIPVRPIPNMNGMNTPEKEELKKEFTDILTKLLVGNKTSSSLFSFITITQIVYVGEDATSISIYNQGNIGSISGTGFHIKYTLHSKSRVNSTVLDNQIKTAAQNGILTNIHINEKPVPITLNVSLFITHNDSANTICEDSERTITCDNRTTECQSDKGDYICKCKTGYQKSSTGPDRSPCYDIDECTDQNISDMCIKGTCVNANPGWNCSCQNATYKTWRQTADGIYRCQGNFQYIGNLSLTWQRAPYQNKSLVESFAVKTVTNVYNQSMDRYIDSDTNTTMKDIFNYVEVQNIIVRSSFGTIVPVLDVIFILHLGETVPTQWVDSVLKSTNIKNGTFFEFSGIHGTIKHMHIYADSNKSMCDIPGKTNCSILSTNCVGKSGTYSCQCKTGFDRTESDSLHSCSDIDECTEPGYSCTNGNCTNSVGGWVCMCDKGYTANTMTDTTKTCIDINECKAPTEHMCSHGGNCSNNNGNWTCVCPTGRHPIYFNSSYILCNDIDECADSLLYTCEGKSAKCNNTDGAWDCECDDGFRQNNITDNKRECVDIDECSTGDSDCSQDCHNEIGSYKCSCETGFTLGTDQHSCEDIDECTEPGYNCTNGTCTNSVGRWGCMCDKGYTANTLTDTTKTCIDIDECLDNETYKCIDGECKNNVGNWTCTCPSGYGPIETSKDMSYICTDIDECQEPTEHMCSHGGNCSNNNGNWTCVCPAGRHSIYLNSSYILCNDTDECADSLLYTCEGKSAKCNNTDGAWDCECDDGFRQNNITDNKRECVDIDECSTGDSDCSQDCHNEIGSYKCSCETGFTLGTDQHTCEDNDECALAADKCVDKANTKCRNTDGSFICMCVEGFYKNREDACESETTVGQYKYYSEVTFPAAASVLDINAMDKTQKQQLKHEFTDILTDLLVGSETAFSFITITLIEYVGGTVDPIRIARDTTNTQQNVGFHIEYTLHSKESLNSTQVEEEINEAVTTPSVNASNSRTVTINGKPLLLPPVKEENIKIVDDSKNPICKDNSTVKTCDLKTTECKANRGLYKCQCLPGFEESADSNRYCIDINECKAENMASRCVHGKCDNTRGSWNCTCPDSPYKASSSRHIGNDTYRCEGDFQYFGSISFYLSGQILDNEKLVKFAQDKIQAIYNESNDTNDGIFPAMKDIYKNVEIDNIRSTNVAGNSSVKIDIQFIVHVGESVSTKWIATFPNETAIGGNTMIGANTTIEMDISIYSDSQKNVCNITGRTKCHLKSTNCEGSNGTYICICKDGYERTDSGYVCTDIDERNNGNYTCSHNGTKVNSLGSWACTCPKGRQPKTISDHEIDCKDIDECNDTSYVCKGVGNSATCINRAEGGGWTCHCKDGFKAENVSDNVRQCIDINECKAEDMASRCVHGKCDNTRGSWNCTCPDSPYKASSSRHVGNDTYRCEGDFQYFGSISFYLSGQILDNETLVKFAQDKIQAVYNESNDTNDGIFPAMKDIYKDVEIYNISSTNVAGVPFIKIDIQFILHVGESVSTEWISTFPNKTAIDSSTTFGEIQLNIYSDSQKNVCNITGRTKCHLKSTNCEGSNGTYTCICKDGYERTDSGYVCADIDECGLNDNRCTNGTCANSPAGSWSCDCKNGYKPTFIDKNNHTQSCQNINECEQYTCGNGICVDTVGDWRCNCNKGYKSVKSGALYVCKDINETTDGNYTCSHGGHIVNSVGSWKCECPKGSQPNEKSEYEIDCEDINECNDISYVCKGVHNSSNCTNIENGGGWMCDCMDGFKAENVSDKFRQCVDEDECSTGEGKCVGGTCKNTIGHWYCQCPKGFENTPNRTVCKDIDECTVFKESACRNAISCENADGSWNCKCDDRLKIKDVNTTSKICEGELQFLGSVSIIIVTPNVNKEDLIKAMEKQLTESFKTSLGKGSVFVEVIRVYETSRRKRDTFTSHSVTADYIVHTDINVSFDEIKNATAEVTGVKSISTPSSSNTIQIVYSDAKTFDNDTICLTADTNVCNSNTSTCAYQLGIVRCDCKNGYEKPPGNLNSYECQNVNECERQSPKACSKGEACTDTDGSWTCKCGDGYKDVEHNGQKECQDVCDTKKCIEEEECEHANNTDGYICRCKVGWTGQYCDEKIKEEEETKSEESNLQTIAIATGTSLGGLVLILAVVVLVVCRLRSQKAKEAEQLASGRINNGFNRLDGSFLGQNYITDNNTGFYDTGSINDGRRNNSNFNEYTANPVYSKSNKTGRPPSPSPDYEADRINPNSLRPVRVLPNVADIDRRIPSRDYDPPRDYGSERLNVSHDSRMNGYAQNGSLDRNYRRGRHNNELRYSSLDRDINRSQRVTQF